MSSHTNLPDQTPNLLPAIKSNNLESLSHILSLCPPHPLRVEHAALIAALDTPDQGAYKLLIEHSPELVHRDLGHMGNVLGVQMVAGNASFVEYLLGKGAKPQEALWMGKPAAGKVEDPGVKKVLERYHHEQQLQSEG